MAATKGNQFWKARATHGRERIFKTPEIMMAAACEYFEWVEDNPLSESIVYQGELSEKTKPLMRAMTLGGLCIFLDVSKDYFNDFEKSLDLDIPENKDFSRVIKTIREIILTQKIEGAAAGLLKENIIARETGLSDKSENSHTGPNGGPLQVTSVEFVGVSVKD